MIVISVLRENGIEFFLKYFTKLVVFFRDSFKSAYYPVFFLVLLYIKEISLCLVLVCWVLRTLCLLCRYPVGVLRTVLLLVYLVRLSFRVLCNFYYLCVEGFFVFFILVGVTSS